jgi:hypothetical protein
MYKLPGQVYAYGPVKAKNKKEAIKFIKAFWELPRKNFEIWETTQESIDIIGKCR